MSVPSERPPSTPAPAIAPANDDARRPRSLADRLRLFLLLIVLPALVVCIPVVLQTHFFGQRPAAKAPPHDKDVPGTPVPMHLPAQPSVPNDPPHTEELQKTLEQSASNILPGPPALGPDPLVVTTHADRLAARMEKIAQLAKAFGGSASEGLSTATEKRLSVDLPAGQLDAFKEAVKNRTTPATPSPATASPAAGHDYIDIIIRTADEDE